MTWTFGLGKVYKVVDFRTSMFIGHEAVALAAKRIAPRTSLGTLVMAVGWLDLVWPVFLLLGIERVQIDPGNTAFTPLNFVDYPYTHSLLFAVVWAIVFGTVYFLVRGDLRASFITAFAVWSHWILDAVVHRPDLVLVPGGNIRIGLGLWNSIPATLTIEIAMFAAGIIIYLRSTKAKGAIGKVSFWSFIIFLMAIYFSSINAPPPDERTLAYLALLGWLPVVWAYWIDRTRKVSAVPEFNRQGK